MLTYQYSFSGSVPFPHSFGLQGTAIFLPCDISFSPHSSGPGIGTWAEQDHFFFSWEFWQSWWGRKKKEQRRQKEKISLSFCGPLPSTKWSREVLVAATWTGTQNARDGWSRRTERRERQKLLSVLCYPSHWLRSEGPQAYAAAGSELPPTEDHVP